ncbi:methyltransferase domain containing protein [Nitzschia inconspicua]|uniref:Methyltransferase domain containing protein n=1 Tax=Nitzschia inconspicua TaxID=303405 RepID=A0A9K3PEH3_9STRA|nr:methyltransferase domain containing protein [Nitzschia inconspicua]
MAALSSTNNDDNDNNDNNNNNNNNKSDRNQIGHTAISSVYGRIIRKRKHHTGIAYAIKPFVHHHHQQQHQPAPPPLSVSTTDNNNDTPPVLVLVSRDDPSVTWCFVGAVVDVELEPVVVDTDTDTLQQQPEEKKDYNDDDHSFRCCDTTNDRSTRRHDIKTSSGDSTIQTTSAFDSKQSNHTIKRQRKHLRDAKRIKLIQCSPDPNAIVACLEMVLDGILPLSAFPSTTCCQDMDQIRSLLSASPKDEDRRKTIMDISRHLQVVDNNNNDNNNNNNTSPQSHHYQYHHPDAKNYGTAKARPPKIKRRFWFVLEQMENTIPRIQPVQSEGFAMANNSSLSPSLNVTALEDHLASYDIPNEDRDDLEPSSALSPPPSSASSASSPPPPPTTTTTNHAPINIPHVNAMSNKHQISRMDYMKIKKWPQVRWLLHKLKQIIETVKANNVDTNTTTTKDDDDDDDDDYIRILDVGGGRGDLAVAMAQSFSNVHVTVVDVNETSLEAGKQFAEKVMGKAQADRQTSWYCSDFANFVSDHIQQQQKQRHRFDVVVAWHACGDLSDYASEFATRTNASFIICPCCYTKRYIEGFQAKWIGNYISGNTFDATALSYCSEVMTPSSFSVSTKVAPRPYTETMDTDILAIQRMAEINEHVEVSQRAMLLINSMRLISLSGQAQMHRIAANGIHETDYQDQQGRLHLSLSLEQYDIKHSSKNLVLVGIRTRDPS